MTTVTMPIWNASGVIPPIDVTDATSPNRSPYNVSLVDFVLYFSTTPERISIVRGFLNYRAALHAAGLNQGFQWIDGSFLENVEMLESRAPHDIDLVTFFRLPAGVSQQSFFTAQPIVGMAPADLKTTYKVDAYLVDLGSSSERLIKNGSYWYSMWSHRRNGTWKGFVQLDLSPANDARALQALPPLTHAGGNP